MTRSILNIKVLSLTCCILFSLTTYASQVPESEAALLAKRAFAFKSEQVFKKAEDIKITDSYTHMEFGEASYFVFNMVPKGFVIVSAEDDYNAVLAFSDESQLNLNNTAQMLPIKSMMSDHVQRIEQIRTLGYNPTKLESIATEWSLLRGNPIEHFTTKNDPEGMVIPPLTTTKWNQGEFYNAYTPKDTDPASISGHTYCGCAPIAMAQLVKYHNYPVTGNGAITYDDPNYGRQSVDFCRDYNWSNMPDSLAEHNNDVAEFIYHIGASTQTYYSITYTNTFTSYIRDALVRYWNFDRSVNWFFDEYNDMARVAIQDLNRGRPLLITGEAWSNEVFEGSHAWVVDGYGYFLGGGPSQQDEYFHFNWGWGGDNNGWFLDNSISWAPIPNTVGTRDITYYLQRWVIHNIFPAEENCGAPLSLYTSQVSSSSANLNTDFVREYEQVVNFRYRAVGTSEWIVLPENSSYVTGVRSLEPETEYEYQVRKQCCDSNWSAYTDSDYFTTEAPPAADPCTLFQRSQLRTSNIMEETSYIYTSQPYGSDAMNQFRYRFVGSFLWNYTDVSTDYYRFLSGLEPGTEYEFQVRHRCEGYAWSGFSDSAYFTTEGRIVNCTETLAVNLFTSSTTESKSYIYTTRPYGDVNNQFRYRATNTDQWIESDINSSYYRYLTGLEAGTEYEFQVSHNCEANSWTEWSFPHTFTTLGGSACDPINGDRLYYSAVSSKNAYVYTPQPFGQVANQFRYRKTGSPLWLYTSNSTLYYRYLQNLNSSTTYEYQSSHECTVSVWTEWSTSQEFTTASGIGGGTPELLLPPRSDEDYYTSRQIELSCYPNPMADKLSVDIFGADNTDGMLRILSTRGDLMMTEPISDNGSIDVSHLSSGIYLVQYTDGKRIVTRKVVKL